MEPQNQPVINSQPMISQDRSDVAPTTVPPSVPPVPTVIPPVKSASQNGDKKVGPIIATLIIVLILIIAALYLFASRINQPAIPDDNAVTAGNLDGTQPARGSTASPASTATEVQPVTNTSTDVNSLQSDLNNSTAGLDNQNF